MKDYDFDSMVEKTIRVGDDGVALKKQLESLVIKFMQAIARKLSEYLGREITIRKESSLIDDGSSSSILSFVSPKARSETSFDVYASERMKDSSATRRYKLFSYEYDEEKVLPVVLRYGGASVACTSEDKVIEALDRMFRARAVQLIEWCNKE